MIVRTTKSDETLQSVLSYMQSGWPGKEDQIIPDVSPYYKRKDSLSFVNGCLRFNSRIVIPEIYRKRILKQLHRGHFAIEKCKTLARSYVYWPNIDKDIEDYVKKCQKCQLAAKNPVRTDLSSWPITIRALELSVIFIFNIRRSINFQSKTHGIVI